MILTGLLGALPRPGIVAVLCGALLQAGTAAAVCVGDCNRNGTVTVDELLLGVNIALGIPGAACAAMDTNGDGFITIDELLAAVNAALSGCPANQPPAVPSLGIYRTYSGYPINLPIGSTDPDGDLLSYVATDLPEGAQLDEGTGVLSWTPSPQQVGPFYVHFRVTDDGAPPQSVDGMLTFAVSPLDLCTQATCDPAAGCVSTVLPLTQPCCVDVPTVRAAEPAAGCPEGEVLFVGRNLDGGFGRLQNCDWFRVINAAQTSAVIQFNLEARCVNINQLLTLQVRMETARRVVVNAGAPVVLRPRDDGYVQQLGVTFPVQAEGPFFDFDAADATMTVTLTGPDGLRVSQQLRVTLTFMTLPDLPDASAAGIAAD